MWAQRRAKYASTQYSDTTTQNGVQAQDLEHSGTGAGCSATQAHIWSSTQTGAAVSHSATAFSPEGPQPWMGALGGKNAHQGRPSTAVSVAVLGCSERAVQ